MHVLKFSLSHTFIHVNVTKQKKMMVINDRRNEGRRVEMVMRRKRQEMEVGSSINNQNVKESTKLASFLIGNVPILIYPALSDNTGYSQASYYTSLGLFLLSLPGLWSLIKRSAKSKIVQKTFTMAGPSSENGKPLNQIAAEITSFFMRNNFVVASRGETITFEGEMTPSRGQAAFLVFCSCISLASFALVLTITVPDIGDKWYWLTVLSPLAGWYYWVKASRKEQIKVKMVVADDQGSVDVVVQGDDEQVDQLRRELKLMEKGMVYVRGIFEQ